MDRLEVQSEIGVVRSLHPTSAVGPSFSARILHRVSANDEFYLGQLTKFGKTVGLSVIRPDGARLEKVAKLAPAGPKL